MKINRQPAWVYLLDKVAENGVRYSIVIVLAWIGMMKFTSYEAGAIEGLVASSPLTSWLYSVFSLQGASNLIGLVEVATAIALLLAPSIASLRYLVRRVLH